MIQTALKYLFIGVLCYLAYKSLHVYSALQFGQHMNACMDKAGMCALVKQRASAEQIGGAMRGVLSCAKDKQSVIESIVFPIKKDVADTSSGTLDYRTADQLCAP